MTVDDGGKYICEGSLGSVCRPSEGAFYFLTIELESITKESQMLPSAGNFVVQDLD